MGRTAAGAAKGFRTFRPGRRGKTGKWFATGVRDFESFNNRLRKEGLNRHHWTSLLESWVVIEDFKDDHDHRHRHSSLSYLSSAEYAVHCTRTHQPVDGCEID
nr:hypothetical protein GCM10017611_08610 [Rhodococcus wratislaviensis]